jgi:hypothetical protein
LSRFGRPITLSKNRERFRPVSPGHWRQVRFSANVPPVLTIQARLLGHVVLITIVLPHGFVVGTQLEDGLAATIGPNLRVVDPTGVHVRASALDRSG